MVKSVVNHEYCLYGRNVSDMPTQDIYNLQNIELNPKPMKLYSFATRYLQSIRETYALLCQY